jgi:hypothetical protein
MNATAKAASAMKKSLTYIPYLAVFFIINKFAEAVSGAGSAKFVERLVYGFTNLGGAMSLNPVPSFNHNRPVVNQRCVL